MLEVKLRKQDLDRILKTMDRANSTIEALLSKMEEKDKNHPKNLMQIRVAALRRIENATKIIDDKINLFPAGSQGRTVLQEIRKVLWEVI